MRKILPFLILISALGASAQSYTTVTATNVLVDNGSGTAIHPPAGTSLCFLGVNNLGAAITYTPSGGSPTSGPVCQTLTSGGALTGSLQVANAATASPVGLYYTITVVNGLTTYLTIPVTPVSGTLFSFDSYGMQGTQSALGYGFAHLACSYGARWTSTSLPAGQNGQVCNMAGTWQGYPPNPYCAAGNSYNVPQSGGSPFCLPPVTSGFGSPSGFCTTNAVYMQQDATAGANQWDCIGGGWVNIVGSGGSGITALTGDVTATGPGSVAATIANNAVTTSKINNSAVTLAKIQNASANSMLLGSGASGSGSPYTEITLGTNLSMSGTTLNATGGGGTPGGTNGQPQVNQGGTTFAGSAGEIVAQSTDTIASIESNAVCASSMCLVRVNQALTDTGSSTHAMNSNVVFEFGPLGEITCSTPHTITGVQMYISSAPTTHWNSSCTVQFAANTPIVLAEWLGTVQDGNRGANTGTDNAAALSAGLVAIPTGGKLKLASCGQYLIGSGVVIPSNKQLTSNCEILNQQAMIFSSSASAPVINEAGSTGTPYVGASVSNLILARGPAWAANSACMYLHNADAFSATNVTCADSGRAIDWLMNSSGTGIGSNFTNVSMFQCYYNPSGGTGPNYDIYADGSTGGFISSRLNHVFSHDFCASGSTTTLYLRNQIQDLYVSDMESAFGGLFLDAASSTQSRNVHINGIKADLCGNGGTTACIKMAMTYVSPQNEIEIGGDGSWVFGSGGLSGASVIDLEGSYGVNVHGIQVTANDSEPCLLINGGGLNTVSGNQFQAFGSDPCVSEVSTSSNKITNNTVNLVNGSGTTGFKRASTTSDQNSGNICLYGNSGSVCQSYDASSNNNQWAQNNSCVGCSAANAIVDAGSGNQMPVVNVASAPSGACTLPTPAQYVTTTGAIWGCQSSVWTNLGSGGSVTAVSIATANGFSGSSSGGSTPALTIVAGAITPTSTNGVSAATMAYVDATSSIQTQLNSKAPLASPTFTGVPAAPTASGGTSTTQLATTAFVQAAIAAAGTGAGIVTYSGPSLAFSGTQYFPIGGGATASATETNVDIDSPAAVTIQNMTVQMSVAPGVGNSVVYTWRKNGSSTALTCTISGASATSCSDTTHNFSTVALDLLDIQAVTTGTIAGTPTVVMAAQLGVSAVATVSSFSGDGGFLNNSLSTGAVTATLATAGAHNFWGNNTGSTTTPGYQSIGAQDVSPQEYVAGGGTAQAQTATLSPAATSLATGLTVRWKPTAANTAAAPTLAVNGLTATAITKCGTTALVANDLTTAAIATATYDGTQFQLLNPQATGCGAAGAAYPTPVTTTASASAFIDVAGCITSSNRDYEIRASNLVFSAASGFYYIQFSTNNGSTWDTASTYRDGRNYQSVSSADSGLSPNESGNPGWEFSFNANSTTTFAGSFKITLFNPLNATVYKLWTGQFMESDSSSRTFFANEGGRYDNANAINDVRIIPTTGTITSGTITCQPLPQ